MECSFLLMVARPVTDKGLFMERRKPVMIILDDDPTGVQCVHDINVYTVPDIPTLIHAMQDNEIGFFILTNSRSFTEKETVVYHQDLTDKIIEASAAANRDYLIISRGDSTLRGHYPLETRTIADELIRKGKSDFDGEIFIPFFLEGGRITKNDIHYVIQDGMEIPAGESEFASDKTFGYANSNLRKYIEEKSHGLISAEDVISFSPAKESNAQMLGKLIQMSKHDYAIVNAVGYADLDKFVVSLELAIKSGKRFIFRTAGSFVKSIMHNEDKALLERTDLDQYMNDNGGLIIIGSHVKRTTEQFNELKQIESLEFIEFNQHRVLEAKGLESETMKTVNSVEKAISSGRTAVVYTRRERIDFPSDDKEANLKLSTRISESITDIAASLSIRPSFIIAKGGITSSEIGVKGLGVRKALVLGQIDKGIPVWLTGRESKFPFLPYIIFPGNVGSKDTLANTVRKLIPFSL